MNAKLLSKATNIPKMRQNSDKYKDYLGFRHVFRHSYGYELDWLRLNPLFS